MNQQHLLKTYTLLLPLVAILACSHETKEPRLPETQPRPAAPQSQVKTESRPIPAKAPIATAANHPLYVSYRQHLPPFRFEDFRVQEQYSGPAVALNLASHADARYYRKTFSRGLLAGVNFAGHYTLVGTNCSPGCQEYYLLDTTTGHVLEKVPARMGAEFRPDSRLLIINPPKARIDYQHCTDCAPVVYMLEKGRLFKARLTRS